MRIVRVAICQIETHPAVYSSHIAYLEEPFVPPQRDCCLSHFATNGLDVTEIQRQCKEEYVSWARLRLQAILDHLSKVNPAPGLVVFPELSIPIENLSAIATWSKDTGSIVLAGTHTPLSTTEAKNEYRQIGIDSGQINKLTHKGRRSLLPMFSLGKPKLIPKKIFSPFEHTVVGSEGSKHAEFRGYDVICGGIEIKLVPLICSEALAAPQLRGPIDLIVIPSFDTKPEQFQGFCSQQVKNKRAVVYCNDGAHGGSRLCVIEDQRIENWLSASFPAGLPSGDSYMVADVDLDVVAVEVGTARPAQALRLIELGSIVNEHSAAGNVSSTLAEIARLKDSAARAQELNSLLARGDAIELQRLRINHLYEQEKRGASTSEWWPVIGKDCVVKNSTSLRELEAKLAATCTQHLISIIGNVTKSRGDLSRNFVEFLAECERRGKNEKAMEPRRRLDDIRATLDRDDEAGQVYRFLDNSRLRLLEVSGLPQIGKSASLDKALSQAGVQRIVRIPLNDSSSPDYIVYSLMSSGGGGPKPPYADPVAMALGEAIARAIRTTEVVLLEDAQELLEYGMWRDTRFPALLAALINVVEREKKKLIIETRRDLPVELSDVTLRTRLRVNGLRDTFARALLDGQLRRVGLSPEVVTDAQKEIVAKKLGGHPIAIAIAADAIYESGASDVVDQLQKREGFFLNFLRAIVARLNLSDEEQTLLRLLGLARDYIPRTVAAEAADFNVSPFMRNLLALGTVESGPLGMIRIAPILRDYFDSEDLPTDLVAKFHRSASTAFTVLSKQYDKEPQFAVEADYHGRLAGIDTSGLTELVDGALAVAKNHFAAQKYDEAFFIVEKLLQKKSRSLEVVRLAAQIQARRNKFQSALELAKDAFGKNRNDTWLLAELAKIALTLSRDDIAEELVDIAERAAVEDTSILIVKGRMALRRRKLDVAAQCFDHAKQITDRNAWPFFYLGRVYAQLGRMDDAIDVLFEGEQFIQTNNIRARHVLSAIRSQLAYCYLYINRLDLAEPLIMRLWEEQRTPEVIRAYAALTIKKQGISQAHQALEQLERAEIKNRYDRCQFHLLYGLFYLGINEPSRASAEFQKAHQADKTNVFVMIKLARTLLTIATELWTDGSDEHIQSGAQVQLNRK